MAYGDHIRRLLAPLGVYDLGAQSISGAMIDAMGEALDDVWQNMQNSLRDAFPQTAYGGALAQWERALPPHGDGTPAQRRAAISFASRAYISCATTSFGFMIHAI